MEKVVNYLKDCFKSKRYGFYVSLVAFVLMLLLLFIYPAVQQDLYNASVIVVSVIGLVLYVALNLHKRTSSIASVALMISSFLSLIFFVQANGFIDYFSTQFFSGVSLKVIFGLPFPVLYTVLAALISFIIASVSMYLPTVKTDDKE